MCYDYLIVATSKQCYVYSMHNMSTPHIFDIKGTVSLILQSSKYCKVFHFHFIFRYFLLVDSGKGIGVFSYEGRLICSPKVSGLRPEFLRHGNISLSSDTLAIIDRVKSTRMFVLNISY